MGRWLAANAPTPSLVLTSPLRRATETCRLAGFAARAEDCEDLVEWDYGAYEGRTSAEIREHAPGWTLWAGGVPAGERAAQVGRRADRVLARARAAQGDAVLFAHGHVLRVLAARWLGLPPAGGRLLALDAGAVSQLGWEREAPVVVRWNLLVALEAAPADAPAPADAGAPAPTPAGHVSGDADVAAH